MNINWNKYFLLALITASLSISESWGVNLKLKFLDSTAVAQTVNDRKAEANRLLKQGWKQFNISQFKQALKSWEDSLAIYREIGNRKGIANSLMNLGTVHSDLGKYHKAIQYHQQSLAISKRIRNRLGEAQSLTNLGLAYHRLGNYRKAIQYHQQSLAIDKEIDNPLVQANSLLNLGMPYYSLGDYRKAIQYQEQSLAIFKEIGNPSGQANSLMNLGIAYYRLGNYRKAIQYQEQSLAIFKEIGNPLGQAKSQLNLGLAHHSLGDYRKAIQYQEQSLAIFKEIGNPLGQSQSLNNLGNAYYRLGDDRKAIRYYQQSLAIDKEIVNPFGQAVSLNNLGDIYRELKQYENAEKNFRQAIAIWENIRSYLGNQDTNKVNIFDTQAVTYRLQQQVQVAQKKPYQALITAERGRTRALVEILIKSRNPQLKENIIPPAPNLAQIQQVARKQNATLVEYSVTPDEIYVWVIPPQGKIQFRTVPLPKNISLQELVKITRKNQLDVRGRGSDNSPRKKDNSQDDSTNRLKQLHQLLIKPIADLLPQDEQQRVIFIPHQELFLVPFVALQDEKDKYLIEKHTILTAPSIQALSLTQPKQQAQQKQNTPTLPRGKEALIVGNPTMPKGGVGKELEPLTQLPGAEKEANNIAQMLGTKALIGDQATESAIVQKMASAKLIHLATHGLLDDTNAVGSAGAIALTPSGKEDGFLTTVEIMERFGLPNQQKLQAELVVLSACDTGKGDIKGEGVVGLSRAFMAAGVPTLVVSLWKVPDGQTATLMNHFYTNIDEKKFDKAKAMREAMLTMIRDGDPDPRNWAAFTVIGKAE
ncbi:CHAT domain-containing tetratricopeptide repeat protein [Mastigocoleus sp. MO_188.B34]|uniref:CHAT domain-containing protein n=1 Tax=Mastigocoleus sp. MO_188.B34 TaxID=3036635 RepID=UPI0026159882|nr:CHAT domain-containing tetratricopeptide repeat protein [Mastigocoleus sp. MO_188.B34]MDJ0694235.1 CHAT domain-containing tetratricopeptide repeat protein [Mastigocoleus sp. MO_188.B34]